MDGSGEGDKSKERKVIGRPESGQVTAKFRYNRDKYPNLSLGFSKGLGFYVGLMPNGSEIHDVLRRLFPSNRYYDDDSVIAILKDLGAIFKAGGDHLTGDWKTYVSLETCGGYRKITSDAIDLDAEAVAWVVGKKVYNPAMVTSRQQRWTYLDRLVPPDASGPRYKLTLREFLSDPTRYATTGSGKGLPRLRAKARYWKKNDGMVEDEITLPSSRWAGFLASTVEELEYKARRYTKQKNRMFIKPDEPAKVRSIVVGDVDTALKMSYVGYYAEAMLKGARMLPMMWTEAQRAEEMVAFAKSTQFDDLVHMPLDQSAFDANVSSELVLDVVSWLVDLARRAGGGSDVAQVGEALQYSLDGGTLAVEGGATYPIERGVLSGWKWTALIDSLANYVQYKEISSSMGVSAVKSLFQGDDALLTMSSDRDAVTLALGYTAYGLDVNPTKFWISTDRDEFLRLVSESGNVVGYPARTITGLLFMRPGGTQAPPLQQLTEQTDSWERLVSRGGIEERVRRYQVEELMRILAVNREVADAILHTPKAVGGMGIAPYATTWMVVETDKARTARFIEAYNVRLLKVEVSILDTVLGFALPRTPARVREYRIRENVNVPRIHLKSMSSNLLGMFGAKVPVVQWTEWNNIKKMQWEQELIRSRTLPSGVPLAYPQGVWARRARWGKTAWVAWLRGSLVASPVNATSPAIVVAVTEAIAVENMQRLGRVDFHQWRVAVEINAQTATSNFVPTVGY
jgi:hypothetical protein